MSVPQLNDEKPKSAGKASRPILYDKLDDSEARRDMLEKSANFLEGAFVKTPRPMKDHPEAWRRSEGFCHVGADTA